MKTDNSCTIIGTKPGQKAELLFTESQTVDDLKTNVERAFRIPKATIRLLFCGKELKPLCAKLSSFNFGRYGNYIIHMSTSTVDLDDGVEPTIPKWPRITEMVDLTDSKPSIVQRTTSTSAPIDLTGHPQAVTTSTRRQRKKRQLERAEECHLNLYDLCDGSDSSPPPPSVAGPSLAVINSSAVATGGDSALPKAIRFRIARALHHRLYLLQHSFDPSPPAPTTTPLLGDESTIMTAENGNIHNTSGSDVLRCLVQGGGGTGDRHEVRIGLVCSCDCGDDFRPSPVTGQGGMLCKHIIFVLLKVRGLFPPFASMSLCLVDGSCVGMAVVL